MLLQFDGTIIFMAVSFIIFMVIMQQIFYAPMSQVMEERDNYIKNNLDTAENIREQAANINQEYNDNITQTRIKASNLVADTVAVANKEKTGILDTTSKEVNNQAGLARNEILKDKDNAKAALKSEVLTLAHSISSKILGEEIPISGITQEMIDKELNR